MGLGEDDDIDDNPTPSVGHNNHTQQPDSVEEKGQVEAAAALANRGGSATTMMIPAPDNSAVPNNSP